MKSFIQSIAFAIGATVLYIIGLFMRPGQMIQVSRRGISRVGENDFYHSDIDITTSFVYEITRTIVFVINTNDELYLSCRRDS